jgi:hypothetical protein
MPRRVRPSGDYYHPVIPDGAVYVGRPAPYLKGSPYANPYPVRDRSPEALAVSRDRFRRWVAVQPQLVERARVELAGRDLCCWCRLDAEWCHADDWLRITAAGNPMASRWQSGGTLPSDLRSESDPGAIGGTR